MPWHNCRVDSTGVNASGEVAIRLQDTNGNFGDTSGPNPRWFEPSPSSRREMLAMALTAISTGLLVAANLESEAREENSRIAILHVLTR
jgi:hypothetical protein